MTLADGKSTRFGGDKDPSGDPVWSPDSQSIAYHGRVGDKAGLVVAQPDGSGARLLAEVSGTNAPLPGASTTASWSPDGKRIAFVSSTPGPETADADRRSDGHHALSLQAGRRRGHDALQRQPAPAPLRRRRRLSARRAAHRRRRTTSTPIDWSPNGDEMLFLTNRDADDDEFFNYDVFALTAGRQVDPTADRDGKQRVPPALVARREDDRVPGDQARPHRSRDDDGGHARVGDERRRHGPARDRRSDRQPPGRRRSGPPDGSGAAVHRAGARQRAALSRCPSTAAAAAKRSSTSAARSGRSRWRRTALAYTLGDAVRSGRSSTASHGAGRLTDLNAAVLGGKPIARGRVVHVHLERQQVRGRGVPDQAGRPARADGEVSADRQHPRRPARPAGAGVQFQEPGVRRARLGDADGELPRLDRLRPGVRRRGVRAIRTATRGRTCSTA